MDISQQPLIRKHSYLGLGYLGGSAYIPCILAPGSMPRGGAEGQNLGHPKKCYTAFSFMLTLKTLGQTSVIHMTQPIVPLGEGQSDLYFMFE